MKAVWRLVVIFCLGAGLVCLHACGADEDDPEEKTEDTAEVLDRDGDGKEECSDPGALNYDSEAAARDDDCSCLYAGFDKLSAEKPIGAMAKNIFMEVATKTGYALCGAFKMVVADDLLPRIAQKNKENNMHVALILMNNHVEDTHADRVSLGTEPYPDDENNYTTDYAKLRQGGIPIFALSPGATPIELVNYETTNAARRTPGGEISLGVNLEALFSATNRAVIGVQSTLSGASYEAVFSIRFLAPLRGEEEVRYKVFLVENVEGGQAGISDYPYMHKNVLREEIAGGVIASEVALNGEGVYTRFIASTVRASYVASYCSLLVVLYRAISEEYAAWEEESPIDYINAQIVRVGAEKIWEKVDKYR